MLERMSQRFETLEQQLKGLDTGMATKVEDNMKRKVGSPSGGQYRGNWKKNLPVDASFVAKKVIGKESFL